MDRTASQTASTGLIEVLRHLLAVELNSIFRFVGQGWPYLTRTTAEIRKPLLQMAAACERRAGHLVEMIDRLGGSLPPRPVQPEDQYLAYLDLKFLLPRLAGAKRVMIQRYQSALSKLTDAPSEVLNLLNSHLAEHRADLEVLEKAAAAVHSQA